MRVTVFSPAKINLYLAVTGRRADGFHDLVSVAAPLEFGDDLAAEPDAAPRGAVRHALECDDPGLPVDGSNLILRAAAAFADATGWTQAVRFRLTKRIPVGAGLGGGSSNAVAALRALNQLAGGIAREEQLAAIAAALGSDCTLFLRNAPVLLRGRGEKVEALPAGAARRLHGRRVLLFKPAFGVATAWAYSRLAARAAETAGVYIPPLAAERHVADWCAGEAPAEALLGNSFEPVVGDKFVALPALLESLRREPGAAGQMSGSGSACFALVRDNQVTAMTARVRASWGPAAFVHSTRLA